MKSLLLASFATVLILLSSCVAPVPMTTAGGPAVSNDGSRNFVLIVHGETCNEENVANNMYVENSHETKTIVVTVDVTWTESNNPRHENRTVTVAPNNKTLLGCEWNGSTYLRYEIMTSKYQ
jgi:hypothetical protein